MRFHCSLTSSGVRFMRWPMIFQEYLAALSVFNWRSFVFSPVVQGWVDCIGVRDRERRRRAAGRFVARFGAEPAGGDDWFVIGCGTSEGSGACTWRRGRGTRGWWGWASPESPRDGSSSVSEACMIASICSLVKDSGFPGEPGGSSGSISKSRGWSPGGWLRCAKGGWGIGSKLGIIVGGMVCIARCKRR